MGLFKALIGILAFMEVAMNAIVKLTMCAVMLIPVVSVGSLIYIIIWSL